MQKDIQIAGIARLAQEVEEPQKVRKGLHGRAPRCQPIISLPKHHYGQAPHHLRPLVIPESFLIAAR
jgi:hypothetical protein